MKTIKTILITWVILYSFSSCDKDRRAKCEGGKMIAYKFDMPVSVIPGNDTIQLGDTLWVELRVDNPILNKLNGNRYDISNATLYLFFTFDDLLLPTVVPSTNYYVLDENGNYLPNTNPDGDIAREVLLKKGKGQLYWRRGFVFTKKGLYMSSFVNFIRKGTQPHITECPYEEVDFNFIFNNSSTAEDKHYYLLHYSPDENVGNWGSDYFKDAPCYAICVD